jgi:threonine aldolase
MRREGVVTLGLAHDVMRLVTHRDVDRAGIDRALAIFKQVLKG